jgi:(2R)-3-sulfolactate dehydrogenase (NADP+)
MSKIETALLPLGELRKLAVAACLACGASTAMAASLVEASLSANWHGRPEIGMAHLLDYLDGLRHGRIDGQAEPWIEQPLPALIHADGRGGIAQLGFDRAFDQLVAAAGTCGIALFAQKDTYTAGELGYYSRRLAQRGLIALAVANSHAMVAPGPHRKAAFGTNPLAFAAPRPAPHPPLVFDQAASATAFVNLARAAAAGTPIPQGWAIDPAGNPTTDPALAVLGALLPFGGAKGANIALMIEVLSAGLSGGAWSLDAGHFRSGSKSPGTGLTIVVIAPGALDPGFEARLESQIERLAGLGVYIPGNAACPMPKCDDAEIPVEPRTLAAIREYAAGTA